MALGRLTQSGIVLMPRRPISPNTPVSTRCCRPVPGSPAERQSSGRRCHPALVNGGWVYNDRFIYDQTKAKSLQDDAPTFNKTVSGASKKDAQFL